MDSESSYSRARDGATHRKLSRIRNNQSNLIQSYQVRYISSSNARILSRSKNTWKSINKTYICYAYSSFSNKRSICRFFYERERQLLPQHKFVGLVI